MICKTSSFFLCTMKICNRSSYRLLTLFHITFLPVLEAQQVKVLPEVTVSIGNDVALPCQFQGPQNTNITQVQWARMQPEGTEEKGIIIVFNSQFGKSIPKSPLSERVKLAEQSLMIEAVEMADAGLYTCSISVFPLGNFESATKLVVQGEVVRLPRMITAGIFGLIIGTMVAATLVIIVRIRRKALVSHQVYINTVDAVICD